MTLNLYIIADYLKDLSFERNLSADYLQCELTHLICYSPDMPLDFHTLYLIFKEDLEQLPDHGESISFLCIGKPSEEFFKHAEDQYLFFPESMSMAQLLQAVQEVFLFFHTWETTMYTLLCSNASLMDVCEHSLILIENPFCLASSDMRILAFGEKQDKPKEMRMFFNSDLGEYVSDEEIDAFRLDQDYLRGIEAHTPCILNNDYFGFRHFYENIFIDDIYAARIAICEVERPIRPSDYALLNTICSFFKIALENRDIVLNNHPKNFDRLVGRLLSGESIPDEEIDSVLADSGWTHNGLYFCGIIESDLDRVMHSYQTLCGQLERFLEGSVAFSKNDRILLLVNLEISNLSKEEIRSSLSPFIRENLLRVGLSNCFRRFCDLPMFARQAQDTLNTGLLKDNTIWCYDFDTYALEILLDRCREGHTPLDLCPEKLQTLIDYDLEHNRNYVHILKTYLQCNMSVAKAMKALYVQRATLLYQLKRIEEISQLNLHDYQTRLYLMLYFQITEPF
jgi:hypothetical protein